MRPETGTLTVIMLMLGIFFHLIPRMRKRNLYFGVTVGEEFRESSEGRAIARDFRLLTWTGTVLALLGSRFAFEQERILLANLAPDLQVAVAIVAWVLAWRRVRGHASQPAGVRSADLLERPRATPGQWLALVLPFAGPVTAAGYLWSRYAELPARYPVHWNAAGHADRYVAKSPMAVFATPLISSVVLLMVLVVALGICFGSRRGSSGEQPGWAARYRRLNLLLLAAIMWAASVMTSTIAVGAILPEDKLAWLVWASLGVLLVTVFGFAAVLIRMSLLRTGGGDATPDACWKGGVIYCNPEDPALMVERRDSIGYTLNLGNRLAWAVLALILLLPVAITVVVAALK